MRAKFAAASVLVITALSAPADAFICNPVMPPCCPIPCPVADSATLAQIALDFSTATDYLHQAQQYASTAKVLVGVLQHGVSLPSLSSILSAGQRLPVLQGAGTTLDSYWQLPQDLASQTSLRTKFAAVTRDAALSSYSAARYQPNSLNAELSPAIGQSLGALTNALSFADGQSASSLTNVLPLLGGAQASTPLSSMIALRASRVTPQGSYPSTVIPATTSPTVAAAQSAANQQQRFSQLVQSLSTLVAFNNARVSAAGLASSINPADGNTGTTTAKLNAASASLTSLAGQYYVDGAAAAANMAAFLSSKDPTTYQDNFSKAVAEQQASAQLAQILATNPQAFGAVNNSTGIQAAQFAALGTVYLEALKTAKFANGIAQTVRAYQAQSSAMLQSLNSAWQIDLNSPQAAQKQSAMASALLSQFSSNADLSGITGYSKYMGIAQAAANGSGSPTILIMI